MSSVLAASAPACTCQEGKFNRTRRGRHVTDASHCDSDIDLVILCPTMPAPPLKPSSSLLHRLASLLLSSSLAEPSSLVVIAKARVPIVKFVTRYGGFSVDLSVNQKNGIDAAVRVRQMLEHFAFREDDYIEPGSQDAARMEKGKGKEVELEQPGTPPVDHGVARSLVLLVKAFLNQRGMNEVFTGGLGSYSIICLVVSFLQVSTRSSSLHACCSYSCDVQLHPKIQTGEINPRHNVGLLFVEFLEYYGKHFNYDEAGITLRGRGGYFNKHNKGWYRPNQPYLLSIEDPNDPSGSRLCSSRRRLSLIYLIHQATTSLEDRTTSFACGRPSPALLNVSLLRFPTAFHISKPGGILPSTRCPLNIFPTPTTMRSTRFSNLCLALSSACHAPPSAHAMKMFDCTRMALCSDCSATARRYSTDQLRPAGKR